MDRAWPCVVDCKDKWLFRWRRLQSMPLLFSILSSRGQLANPIPDNITEAAYTVLQGPLSRMDCRRAYLSGEMSARCGVIQGYRFGWFVRLDAKLSALAVAITEKESVAPIILDSPSVRRVFGYSHPHCGL